MLAARPGAEWGFSPPSAWCGVQGRSDCLMAEGAGLGAGGPWMGPPEPQFLPMQRGDEKKRSSGRWFASPSPARETEAHMVTGPCFVGVEALSAVVPRP